MMAICFLVSSKMHGPDFPVWQPALDEYVIGIDIRIM